MKRKKTDLMVPVGATINFILNGSVYERYIWFNSYREQISKESVDKALDFLFSTFMPYVVMVQDTGTSNVMFRGIRFYLFESGLCEVIDIDDNLESVRIPDAIMVGGRYYLVTSIGCIRSNTSLVKIQLNNVLQEISRGFAEIYSDGITKIQDSSIFSSLTTVECDERGLFRMIDGVLYQINPETSDPYLLVWVAPERLNDKVLVLPDSVWRICENALNGFVRLPTIKASKSFWDCNETLKSGRYPLHYISSVGILQLLRVWGTDDEDDPEYSYFALKRISSETEVLKLSPWYENLVEGLDLEEVNENIKVIELYRYEKFYLVGKENILPSNFIRDPSKLPNLKAIKAVWTDKDGNVHKKELKCTDNGHIIGYLIESDGIFYNIIDDLNLEVGTRPGYKFSAGNWTEGKLILPEKVSYDGLDYSLTTIRRNSFQCSPITSVDIPSSVETIAYSAFLNCEHLKEVNISEGVRVIVQEAFAGCSALEEILLPDSIEAIGDDVFLGCTRLSHLRLPASLKEIGNHLFINCKTVTYTAPIYSLHPRVRGSAQFLTEFKVEPGNRLIKAVDGVVYDIEMKTLIAYPPAKPDAVFVVPDSVVAIADSAFSYCGYLESLILPASLESIGDDAFTGCSIKKLQLPPSLKHIGKDAFMSPSLTEISFSSPSEFIKPLEWLSNSYVSKFSVGAGCNVLKCVNGVLYDDKMTVLIAYPPCRNTKTFKVPASVKVIADGAFLYDGWDGLISIDMSSSSVISIGAKAFYGNYKLKKVRFSPCLKFIGDKAFEHTQVKRDKLPSSLIPINKDA